MIMRPFTSFPSPRRGTRHPVWAGMVTAAAVTVLVGGLPAVSADAAVAAPNLQLPFPCGQQWRLDTWGHAPALDMVKEPDQQGTEGASLVAPAAGTVNKSYYHDNAGNVIQVNHGGGYFTTYLHLQSRAVGVGAKVAQGALIGKVGRTGPTSNNHPHLHFELGYDSNGDGEASWGFAGAERVRPTFNGVSYGGANNQTSRNVTSRNCGGGAPDLGVLEFYLTDDQSSKVSTRPVFRYGNSPMVPISGDWDGDGTDTVSTYDPTSGRFHISNSPANGQAQYSFRYGDANGVPFVGDWDGDGKDNVGVRMGRVFYMRTSPVTSATETTQSVSYGDVAMLPLAGDWDGDGKDTVSAYDPRDARFHISNSPANGQAQYSFRYGDPNAAPFVGDWDGDGKDNVGVRMGYVFYLRTSPVTTATETTHSVGYGDTANLPVIGDWNGDGKDSQGIAR
ncbi:M23 family metallopeptidase [Sphaerisporangium sp. TRM90804]|uniref:M23 family metallopeptidase n=1 Tax=Sphaerisporangium sp. TRM90804 TaxID=3031113 RepID=UPI00244951BA|nr:M23 family metallopeptidase [Sphaerisporangium sp. TRM90804]MDH2426839.1 M23 family metallopeptidase [Sphaerisporangium sp. TRM90804]